MIETSLARGLACALFFIVPFLARAEAPEARPLASAHPSYRAPVVPDAASALPPEPVGTLVLADALAAALARSPSLAAFSWEVRAREAALLQAEARQNPELRVEVEDALGSGAYSGFESAQTTLSVSQLLELGGKRPRRIERASLERDLAAWDYEAARLGVVARTVEAFVAVLAGQHRLAIAEEARRTAEEAVVAVEATVRAGAVSPVEAARARVTRERAAIDEGMLVRRLERAKAALAATWGALEPRFGRVAGELRLIAAPPPLPAILPLADESPELARFATELAERRASVALERARQTPDVRLGLGGRQFADSGSAALVAELSLPLPLYDRNRGSVLEARYRLRRAESEHRAAQAAVGAALRSAYERLDQAFAEATALRERAIPEAEAAFAGAREAWRRGRLGYAEVLDTERMLFALRVDEIDALAAYHTARAELEALTGHALAAATPVEKERR